MFMILVTIVHGCSEGRFNGNKKLGVPCLALRMCQGPLVQAIREDVLDLLRLAKQTLLLGGGMGELKSPDFRKIRGTKWSTIRIS